MAIVRRLLSSFVVRPYFQSNISLKSVDHFKAGENAA